MSELFDVVRTIERERGCRIWCILQSGQHHMCGPTMYSIYSGRDQIGRGKKIEILLHSSGGHPQYAYAVMKFFPRRFREVNVLVPIRAKSAATLMCLGANKVFMGELAELGPIDIQIDDPVEQGAKSFSPLDEFKSIEFMREQAIEWMHYYAVVMHKEYGISIKEGLKDSVPLVTNLLRPLFEQIEPLEMGGNRRALSIAEEYATRMLALTGNKGAKDIVHRLVWEYPSHDFWMDIEESADAGISVASLPEAQDRQLTKAIINYKEEFYYGFAPKTRTPRQSRPVRPAPPRQAAAVPRRANSGRNGRRAEKRPEAPRAAV
jgi:hypothetical protein